MKRSVEATGDAPTPRKQPRQNPVSCQSCRKRKLKCDRQSPCSCCTARRLDCIYTSTNVAAAATPASSSAEIDELQSNIARPTLQPEPQKVTSITDGGACSRTQPSDESLKTTNWLETVVMGHWVPNAVPSALRAELAQDEQTEGLLEHTPRISGRQPRLNQGHAILQQSPALIHVPSYLPPLAETISLFQYYCDNLDYHYHAIIQSRVQQQIQTLYEAHSQTEPLDMGHTALLFSILASALYYKLHLRSSGSASASSQSATFLAGAALIQSNYVAYPTIEGIQAAMIVGHHLSSTDLPAAVSALFVPRLTINQAIHMGLHLVDCPQNIRERHNRSSDVVCLELKRRIWWSLVSNDWLLAYLSGPQEWTYSVNPEHMNVRLPENIEDETVQPHSIAAPRSTPTAMSYTLCRIDLAEVSRQIADETSGQLFHGNTMPYDKIIELDRKLHDALDGLPLFYRFGQAAEQDFASLYRQRPVFAWQRSMLQLGYHFRICRLHRQHFVRGAKDPRYSYSHVVSLRSARTVLEIKRIMDEDEPIMTPSSSMIWAVVHHVFVAAVTLLVDVCYNWEDVLAVKRKEEVIAACRMLTHAQQSSAVARRAVDAMMDLLRKHWVQTRGLKCSAVPTDSSTGGDAQNPANIVTQTTIGVPTPDSMMTTAHTCTSGTTQGMQAEVPLEDLWTEMLDGSAYDGLDTPDWTELLNNLTNTNLPSEQ